MTYLYAMRAPDGAIKVGYSNNPERRRKEIEFTRKHGAPIEVIMTEAVPDGLDVMAAETAAHALLAEHHVYGEWFRTEVQIVADAIRHAISGAPVTTKPPRKQTPRAARLTNMLRGRAKAEERAGFYEAAGTLGMSFSDWARMRLRKAAEEDLARVGKIPKFLTKRPHP